MADTPIGETVTPEAPSNDPGTTSTPQGQSSDPIVEAAKKEAEQARMEANMLRNKLKAAEDAKAEADRKQLEEKEEFKALYEKSDAELKAIREEKEQQERRAELSAATDTVFKDYPSNVVELAKTAGLSLSDDSEAARASLKEKLDTFAKNVGAPTASPNNPTDTAPTGTTEGRLGQPKTIGVDDGTHNFGEGSGKKFSEYVKNIPGIKEMKKQAGYPTE